MKDVSVRSRETKNMNCCFGQSQQSRRRITMATLYELTGELLTLLEMSQDPEIDPEMLADTMEAVEGEIELKADGYAKVIRELEGTVDMVKAEMNRLDTKKKTIENSIGRIKKKLQNSMVQTGKTKFKTDLFNFNVQKNPPSLVIDNPEQIPFAYLIPQDPKVDSAGIKKLLREQSVPWAHLEQTESLRIR